MNSKITRNLLIGLVVFVLVAGAFSGGVIVGVIIPHPSLPNVLNNTPTTATKTNQTDTEKLFVPFWTAWDLVHQQFVTQPVDDEKLMQGAIRGMIQSLNEAHTAYMDPVQYQQWMMPMQGDYEGIGAFVDATSDYLTIVSPMSGYPAEKAGLKTGDKIIAVDGQDMTGVAPALVLRKVLGPAGTVVKLSILRAGEKDPLQFEITRAKIIMVSVNGKMLDNNIAYVQITTFGEKTPDELQTVLKDLMSKKPASLVLDLRNNGGGLLDTAIKVISQFIKQGVLVNIVYGDGTKKSYSAIPNGLATDIPMVVLVNKGSASASEVTAGALRDYGRAQLVGELTYGKGSMQIFTPLPNNEGGVDITVAHWLTPKGNTINGTGLKPDVEVVRTTEDVKANLDPQLDKAVALLTASK